MQHDGNSTLTYHGGLFFTHDNYINMVLAPKISIPKKEALEETQAGGVLSPNCMIIFGHEQRKTCYVFCTI